jgi:hypothetical protein
VAARDALARHTYVPRAEYDWSGEFREQLARLLARSGRVQGTPPRQMGLEQRVLVAVLREPSLLEDLREKAKPEEFLTPAYGALAAVLLACGAESRIFKAARTAIYRHPDVELPDISWCEEGMDKIAKLRDWLDWRHHGEKEWRQQKLAEITEGLRRGLAELRKQGFDRP